MNHFAPCAAFAVVVLAACAPTSQPAAGVPSPVASATASPSTSPSVAASPPAASPTPTPTLSPLAAGDRADVTLDGTRLELRGGPVSSNHHVSGFSFDVPVTGPNARLLHVELKRTGGGDLAFDPGFTKADVERAGVTITFNHEPPKQMIDLGASAIVFPGRQSKNTGTEAAAWDALTLGTTGGRFTAKFAPLTLKDPDGATVKVGLHLDIPFPTPFRSQAPAGQ